MRSDGDYGLSGNTRDVLALALNPLMAVRAEFWGDPAGESHDKAAGRMHPQSRAPHSCPNEEPTGRALLTAPVQCSGAQTKTGASADSWEEHGIFQKASYESADLSGTPAFLSGCNQLSFDPTIEARPTTNLADSPSGLDVDLHQPTDETPRNGQLTGDHAQHHGHPAAGDDGQPLLGPGTGRLL